MKLATATLCLVLGATLADGGYAATDVALLAWLQGEWIGEGYDGENGAAEGIARQYWSPPREGSVSYLFSWHVAETNHVHYALTIFERSGEDVVGRGIHYGPDFETFEAHPWRLRALEITATSAVFECLEHCRAAGVSFRLGDDGRLEERWRTGPEHGKDDWIVRYVRPESPR